MTSRRLLPSLLLAGVIALTACAAPSAPSPAPAKTDSTKPAASSGPDAEWEKIVELGKQEGKVLIYGALLGGPEGSAIAEEFRKQTGITVDFVAGAGSPLYSRIREELKAGSSADLFEGSQPWPSIIQKDGYFLSMKDKPLPVLRNEVSAFPVNPTRMAEGGEFVIDRFGGNVGHVIVNSRLLQPSEYPKSFKEMATEPRFNGKIGWVNPKSTGDVAFKWVQWGYNADSFSLEDVWSIYAKQSPLMLAVPMDVGGAIGRGEGSVGMGTSTIENLLEAGAPIKVLLFPDVPFVQGVAGLGLVKDAPHPNAALVFMNWVLSKPGQEAITTIAKIRSIRKDVPDGTPPGVNPEVSGGGKAGPTYLMTGPQAELAGDLHSAGVFQSLPEGISQADFIKRVNDYIADWESKRGGPQRQQIKIES
jgi:iron(III) transport system substrate-binding protein